MATKARMPIISSGAVSPSARAMPMIVPVRMPGSASGSTWWNTTWIGEAPSASAPSRIDGGTALIALRPAMTITGMVISASVMPPISGAERGMLGKIRRNTARPSRPKMIDGHRGEVVDRDLDQVGPAVLRRVFLEVERGEHPDREGQHERDQHGQDRALERAPDADQLRIGRVRARRGSRGRRRWRACRPPRDAARAAAAAVRPSPANGGGEILGSRAAQIRPSGCSRPGSATIPSATMRQASAVELGGGVFAERLRGPARTASGRPWPCSARTVAALRSRPCGRVSPTAVKSTGDRERSALEPADAVGGHAHEQEHQHRDREQDRAEPGKLEAPLGGIALPQPRLEGGRAGRRDRVLENDVIHKLRGTA